MTAPAPDGAGTVLVVDDEEDIREAVRRILSRHGYEVKVAAEPAEALAVCQDQGPLDLLLTDVLMPQLSGRALAEQVSAVRSGLPVLYISGYPRDVAVGEGLVPQEKPMLEKPFTRDTLLAAVSDALAGRS